MGSVTRADKPAAVVKGTEIVQSQPGYPLFEPVFLPPYRSWRAFIVSAALHLVLIPASPWLANLLPGSSGEPLRRYHVVIRPLEIHVPDLVYVPAGGQAPGERRAAPRPKALARPPQRKPDAVKSPPRRFELPQAAHRSEADQTVLQPQYPPDLPLQAQVRLPNVVLWSAARLPKPEPKRFVSPGSPTLSAPRVPALQAPPRLDLSNRELAVSDLPMTGGAVVDQPALPRPPATTVPLRVFRPPPPGAAGGLTLDAIPGDPANLIALSATPAPMERSIIVPAGNQLGRLPGPPDEADSGGRLSGAEGGRSGEAGGAGAAGGGSGTGPISRTGGGSATGAAGGTGGGAGTGAGHVEGYSMGAGHGSAQLAALSGAPAATLLSGAAVRIVHPNNAVFDIVVQSTSSGAVPDTTGILSGKPVYTVFVHVGYERDWILQYCRPASADRYAQTGGNVVTLGNPAPVKAPYPLLTVAPPFASEPRTAPIMVHGFLDTSGKLKALKLVRESGSGMRQQLFPYLEQWEFRPGTRDGVPILLEILLVIPANKA